MDDIRQENGVMIFDINADGDDKNLKTPSSKRTIPIHNELISSGFLEYITQKQETDVTRVFPDIKMGKSKNYSNLYSKKFRRLLDALDLKKDGLCFHSLRHTFVDGMRNAGVERPITMTLTGHQSSDVHDTYGYGYNLSVLQEAINKLSFSSIEE